MTQPTTVLATLENAVVPRNLAPRLRGRWLFVVRVGWVALTLLILTLNFLAIPQADALLQAVCQPGAHCLSGQLTQADLRQIQQFGLTPGFLAAYQVAWKVGTTLIDAALAALIFWRRPSDRMALYCAYMLVFLGGATYTSLLDLGLRTVAPMWYWLVGGVELLAQVSTPVFTLLFPSGRFVPRWTRWSFLVIVPYLVWYLFFTHEYLGQQDTLSSLSYAVLPLNSVVVQVYRYRRVSTFRERQQTKWVVFGIAGAASGFALFYIIADLFLPPELLNSPVAAALVPTTVTNSLLLLVPISIAIAILRSRLYDIDTIINKTLVYGLLTALLGALYVGLIIGLESLAGLLTRQAAAPVVLVISTLAIAALFLPVRRRIQSLIDRRFYRRKYDAEKTLGAFSITLRQETDLEQIREHLLAVVQETMQPEHVSLWLLQPEWHLKDQDHRLEPQAEGPGSLSLDGPGQPRKQKREMLSSSLQAGP
ncbi:MAG TPA: hypothetical protein VF099_14665 [Ktedonobacterales bacterium]